MDRASVEGVPVELGIEDGINEAQDDRGLPRPSVRSGGNPERGRLLCDWGTPAVVRR
ncbi:MAG: hypothetical protein AVDCRST_MAG19-1169 [uncultured Thermomicrobiales bacterium]|uniref:Uncharacterized protein n=1 Tax=uncultured Thermomicrobiales bacterium TaxID=1645740 RepID=A0A6J4UN70_9BACT|nr:MAG: hypothetical protein AVDCRST_MAG19-1169 [uncultured Thermomicrobiales bacterium]